MIQLRRINGDIPIAAQHHAWLHMVEISIAVSFEYYLWLSLPLIEVDTVLCEA